MAAWRTLWAALPLVALLVGCGGGGGGSGGDSPAPVVTPPTITQQPAPQTAAPGASATFSVSATGNALAYQWSRSTTNGVGWVTISGATSASYTLAPVDAAMNGHQFRVVIQNVAGIVVSDPATLSVTVVSSAPTIAEQPTDQVAVVPVDNDFDSRSAVFRVAATGSPTPTFRWQVNTDPLNSTFVDVPGATGNTFSPSGLSFADNGKRYRAVATNPLGAASTRAALLQVADVGIGGSASGLAVRPSGEVVAAIASARPDFAGLRTATATRVRTLAGREGGTPVDATGTAARFSLPVALALDGAGNAWVIEGFLAAQVRKVTPAGVVSTIAGNGVNAFVDGVGVQASFNIVKGVALGVDGNLYVTDYGNSAIRRVTPAGVVSTYAGGTAGSADGVGRAAQFTNPWGIATDPAGNLYVAEAAPSCRIRKVAPDASVTTVSNTGCFVQSDGPLGTARFFGPSHLAFDGLGNLFVSDQGAIRKIAPDGTVTSPRVFTISEGPYTNGPITADLAGDLYLLRARNGAAVIERQAPNGQATSLPQ
jgi:hypothetical protein